MSKGAAMKCKTDTCEGIVCKILDKIVSQVAKERGWSVSDKKAVHNIYGKLFYGTSVEIPIEEAHDKFGIEYGPTNGSKRVIPMGREISQEEASRIQNGDTALTETPEFKAKPTVIGVDVHSNDAKTNAKRQALNDELDKYGMAATSVSNVMKGIKVLEAGGKKIPAGVEEALTQKTIAGLLSDTKVTFDVNLGGGGGGGEGGFAGKLKAKPKPVGPSPIKQGPLGLMQ